MSQDDSGQVKSHVFIAKVQKWEPQMVAREWGLSRSAPDVTGKFPLEFTRNVLNLQTHIFTFQDVKGTYLKD